MKLTNDMNIKTNNIVFIGSEKIEFYGHMFKVRGVFDIVDYISYFITDLDTKETYELYQYFGDKENYYLITDKEQFTNLEFYGYNL